MAEIHAIRAPVLVPRYVHNVNDLARQHGLIVSDIYVDRYEEQGGAPEKDLLFANWRGCEAQLRSIGLIARSYHFPLESGWIVMPTSCAGSGRSVVEGRVSVSANELVYAAQFGAIPRAIDSRDGVEVITYEDETAYHGEADALIAASIARKCLPYGRRSWHGEHFKCRIWGTRRQPDGTFVHWLEDEAAYKRRLKEEKSGMKGLVMTPERAAALAREYRVAADNCDRLAQTLKTQRPSYLKLVVDNTKETPP
jgi:hypothetical protein